MVEVCNRRNLSTLKEKAASSKLSARRVDSKKETIVFSRSRERSRQNATYARTRCAKVPHWKSHGTAVQQDCSPA